MNVASRNMDTAPDLSVYIADYQSAGRGQRGNRWESAKAENLMFTILMRPGFLKARQQFVISEISALSVAKYLETKGLSVKIKWPNDIYVSDRKICGMLIEHTLCGDNLSVSVSGIGININQTEFDSSLPNPTSLMLETGRWELRGGEQRLQRPVLPFHFQFLEQFLDKIWSIHKEYLIKNAKLFLEKEFLSRLYRKGEWFDYIDCRSGEEKKIEARIVGIDSLACLVLQLRDGSTASFSFKELKYII